MRIRVLLEEGNILQIIEIIFEGRTSEADIQRKNDYIKLFALLRLTTSWWRKPEDFTDAEIDQAQKDFDEFGLHYVTMFGSTAITNYIQIIIGGTLKEFLKMYRNLYQYANISFEGYVGTLRGFIMKRTQGNGSKGGGRKGSANGEIKSSNVADQVKSKALRDIARTFDIIGGVGPQIVEDAVAKGKVVEKLKRVANSTVYNKKKREKWAADKIRKAEQDHPVIANASQESIPASIPFDDDVVVTEEDHNNGNDLLQMDLCCLCVNDEYDYCGTCKKGYCESCYVDRSLHKCI